jgi:hypothetical protein
MKYDQHLNFQICENVRRLYPPAMHFSPDDAAELFTAGCVFGAAAAATGGAVQVAFS